MRRRPIRDIALAAIAAALLPAGALAQSGLPPLTAEISGRIGFRFGPPGAEVAPIWGYLALPSGAARVPAMVIMHGSSGLNPGSRVHNSELLNRYGIAAFYVDSFTGRDISSSVRDQSVLSITDNTRDAFVALRLLRRHPRIEDELLVADRRGPAALVAPSKFWGSFTHGQFAAKQRTWRVVDERLKVKTAVPDAQPGPELTLT
ncbi:MAG TPA: hypothetical protein VIF14_00545 [Alphaproteobacteria bacterium]|jgi:hypothetical protein